MKSKYKGSISTKHFQIYDADSFETKMVIGFDEAYAKLNSYASLVSALEKARVYVDCAYECAFPDDDENKQVMQEIDAALQLAKGE